jgi:hypothetical protein
MGAWSVETFVGVARLASCFGLSENMENRFVGMCSYHLELCDWLGGAVNFRVTGQEKRKTRNKGHKQ